MWTRRKRKQRGEKVRREGGGDGNLDEEARGRRRREMRKGVGMQEGKGGQESRGTHRWSRSDFTLLRSKTDLKPDHTIHIAHGISFHFYPT